VRGLVTGHQDAVDPALELGDLAVLAGVADYPTRVKCALLAWEALETALAQALSA
jgi:nitrogen fixation NifU-like protein